MANRKAQKDKPNRGQPDQYDRDLEHDGHGPTEAERRSELAPGARSVAEEQFLAGAGPRNVQKDRKGQAQSPVELNLNQPEHRKEGH
jgi:hypothetical protein